MFAGGAVSGWKWGGGHSKLHVSGIGTEAGTDMVCVCRHVCVCEYMCTYMSVRERWLPGEKTKFNGRKRVEDR